MSGSRPRGEPPAILIGLILLARGRAEGFAHFGDTPQRFLASLAPLVAFPLVGGLVLAFSGNAADGLMSFLETMCVLLAQVVISEALSVRWRRDERWLRYATAFNWCQWLIPILASFLVVLGGMLLSLGLSPDVTVPLLLAGLGGYALWLQWFLARSGLQISGVRAALLVLAINLGTVLLVLFPRILAALG